MNIHSTYHYSQQAKSENNSYNEIYFVKYYACYNKDKPAKHTQSKKLDTKQHILYDFIYIKCPQQVNMQEQSKFPWEVLVNGHEAYF